MENVWDVLKKEVPTRIDELILSLNACATNITAIRALLSSKAQKYDKLDQLDEAMQVMSANREMLQIENYLNDVIAKLNNLEQAENVENVSEVAESDNNVAFTEESVEEDDDEVEEELADEKTDYTQYLVDQTIPYKLAEDFKNTSPCAFSFDGEKYLVDNWYEITIKVCEILYKKNAKLFSDIVGSCAIKGRKNAYIAFANDYPAKSIGVPRPLLDTNIIIEQRLSANQHMIVVKRLLDKFRIPRTAISIYLESDRKPKHGQIPIGKFLNENTEFYKKKLSDGGEYKSDDSPEKKIGEYVRDYFTVYFADKTKQYDVTNFLNKYWCNEHLGICYPLLKEIDEAKPVSEQKNYNNEYARYWIKPVLEINGRKYILCSQWFEYQRESLESWINRPNMVSGEGSITIVESKQDDFRFSKAPHIEKSPLYKGLNERMGTPSHIEYLKMSEDDKRRHKSRCKEYDKKKDVCMCVQSPYFTIKCGGSSHCKYYSEYNRRENSVQMEDREITHDKKLVEVISVATQKRRKCIHCQGKTERYMMGVDYSDNGNVISNKLPIYECSQCGAAFLVETIFKTYTMKKDVDKISVAFKMRNL